jgi:hypothetical protein
MASREARFAWWVRRSCSAHSRVPTWCGLRDGRVEGVARLLRALRALRAPLRRLLVSWMGVNIGRCGVDSSEVTSSLRGCCSASSSRGPKIELGGAVLCCSSRCGAREALAIRRFGVVVPLLGVLANGARPALLRGRLGVVWSLPASEPIDGLAGLPKRFELGVEADISEVPLAGFCTRTSNCTIGTITFATLQIPALSLASSIRSMGGGLVFTSGPTRLPQTAFELIDKDAAPLSCGTSRKQQVALC